MAENLMETAMFAVAFEVFPSETGYQRYLDIAAALRPKLDRIDGFLSVERFRSLTHPGWILSLSLWRDEAALVQWRSDGEHHAAQYEGRESVFKDYRIRVIRVGEPAPGALVGLREFPPAAEGGKRFQSIVQPGKEIALQDFADAAAARSWLGEEAPAGSRTLCGNVLRDYGLFDRAGAPQVFPPAKR
ncbi:antibiotic biosynthesis monooxygenase [Noviherbaspirillum sp.]|uniref:antibiotic biosynthesis monooxygenase family protein n=1 Tax=Noviherbaspirillum sp. TaxID=1926288 RepID=UPI002D4EB012|nr:antibiotic biosynthesis monooxygenase [Noviherbaspirillum sp.]HZW22572.1 antibiotic biosynthesis monooxygenase [Noviherbaspirillum sp.]